MKVATLSTASALDFSNCGHLVRIAAATPAMVSEGDRDIFSASRIQNAKDIEIDVSPEFRAAPGTDALGAMVCACGFLDARGKGI